MLQKKGMTTFEYIRWKEDRKTASKIVVKIQRDTPKNQKDDLIEFKEEENPVKPAKTTARKKSLREVLAFCLNSKKKSVAQNPSPPTEEACDQESCNAEVKGTETPDMTSPPSVSIKN